jgi:hypothetical protein
MLRQIPPSEPELWSIREIATDWLISERRLLEEFEREPGVLPVTCGPYARSKRALLYKRICTTSAIAAVYRRFCCAEATS